MLMTFLADRLPKHAAWKWSNKGPLQNSTAGRPPAVSFVRPRAAGGWILKRPLTENRTALFIGIVLISITQGFTFSWQVPIRSGKYITMCRIQLMIWLQYRKLIPPPLYYVVNVFQSTWMNILSCNRHWNGCPWYKLNKIAPGNVWSNRKFLSVVKPCVFTWLWRNRGNSLITKSWA